MRLAAMVIGIVSLGVTLTGQPRIDFAGHWVSRGPGAFTLLRFVPRQVPRGPESVSGAASLSIEQSTDRIALIFPGERRNVMTRPPFTVDDAVHEIVDDRGDFWTKYIMRAEWVGDALRLRATSFSGWWRKAGPAAVHSAPSQYETTYDISMDNSRNTLTLIVTIADEKFEAQYRQVFSRAR